MKHSQIEIQTNLELVAQIQWLMKYKAAADEALSYLITNEKDAHAAKLMLNALNIGAHEQPAQQSRQADMAGRRPKNANPGVQVSSQTVDGEKLPPCR